MNKTNMALINQGSQMFKILLSRPNSSVSWGFRLQGGADFSTALSIQLIQPGSVADQAGLEAGDGILQINGAATETLEHEAAKMEIIRAGNDIEFLVQRGAVTTWRPKITPMSELKPTELQTHTLPGEAPPVQRTSLAANQQPVQHIGSSHNRAAKPFGGAGGSSIAPESHISIRDSFPNAAGNANAHNRNQLQQEYLQECGGVVPDVDYDVQPSVRQQSGGSGPGVVHAQYNTPLSIYSNKNVNDSFQQQAGVMKNDFGNMSLHDDQVDRPRVIPEIINNNNTKQRATLAMPQSQTEVRKSPVQLALEEPAETGLYKGGSIQSKSFKILEQELVEGERRASTISPLNGTESVLPAGVKSVQAPKTTNNMRMTGPRYKQPTSKCYVCDNFITGVFVRVKEHCLHSDCLKCTQCNRNLKNIGYIWVQDKIYCVQHARELTRPPGGGYTAYVIDAPDGV